jgi:hypothetical protein
MMMYRERDTILMTVNPHPRLHNRELIPVKFPICNPLELERNVIQYVEQF